MSRPAARVVAMHTDGEYVDAVAVKCVWCGGTHWHAWHNETDSYRAPPCGAPGATYAIAIGAREKIDAMCADFPTPDGVVGLVPLHIGYAFECDGEDDVVGVVMDTALGRFAMWLALPVAVQLAAQLVEIAEDREALRGEYMQRAQTGLPAGAGATNAAGPV